jgi:hypothetical protein
MNGYQLLPGATTSQPYWRIPVSVLVRIGRSNTQKHQNFLILNTSQVVSRNHIELWYENGEFMIADVGSNSGTWINGQRLAEAGSQSLPFKIRTGDVLRIGTDFKTNPREVEEIRDIRHRSIICKLYCRLPASKGMQSAQSYSPHQGTTPNKLTLQIPPSPQPVHSASNSSSFSGIGPNDKARSPGSINSPGAQSFHLLQREIEEKKASLQRQFNQRFDQLQEKMHTPEVSSGLACFVRD